MLIFLHHSIKIHPSVMFSHTIKVPVQRSAPVNTINTNPHGKTIAPAVLIRPGAFSWNHGAVIVLSDVAAAKDSRHPAETALRKTFSGLIRPFLTPARDTSSMV